jgi:predicted RNA-binding Zn ribbon-like protein
VSGNLSLDFANTVDWHAGPDPEERLLTYADAVEWARQQGILSSAGAVALVGRTTSERGLAEETLRRVVALREAVYHIFSAVAHCREPDPADLELLDGESRQAWAHLRLVKVAADAEAVSSAGAGPAGAAGQMHAPSSGGDDLPRFGWEWVGLDEDPAGFLWPVARAATELLTSRQLSRVRECADDRCGWLFLDMSKNSSRRWCAMADCGNRAKARRYRVRRKTSPAFGQVGPSS